MLTREMALAEGAQGGFAGVYPVLKLLEERGQVRRGYFVDGLGAAQFAQPGAVDRLRAAGQGADRDDDGVHHERMPWEPAPEPGQEPDAWALAATDPAQPYGAALGWPETVGHPARAVGAYVVLVDGHACAYLEKGGRSLLTFPAAADHPRWVQALAASGAGRPHAAPAHRVHRRGVGGDLGLVRSAALRRVHRGLQGVVARVLVGRVRHGPALRPRVRPWLDRCPVGTDGRPRRPSSSRGNQVDRNRRYEGKVVFITGVARGQGRNHAVRFAQEGARIIGIDICHDLEHAPYPLATEEDLAETVRRVEAAGGAMHAEVADVRDYRAVREAAQGAASTSSDAWT